MTGRLGVLLLVALGALVGSSVPVSAHAPADAIVAATVVDLPSAAAWQAAAPPIGLPWMAVIVVALLGIVSARRPRRALALTIVLVLALFAFENGVHSIHHLSDRTTATACAVASATTHVAGTPVDAGTSEAIILPSLERLVLDHRPDLVVRSLAAHQGRAPPLAA